MDTQRAILWTLREIYLISIHVFSSGLFSSVLGKLFERDI